MSGNEARATLLLAHHDGLLRDYLAEVLMARGFAVTAVSHCPAAQAAAKDAVFDVVVAAWGLSGGFPGELFQLIDARGSELCERFVHLGRRRDEIEAPGPIIDPWDSEGLVRATEEIADRVRHQNEARISARERVVMEAKQPSMLLVDDEPLELMAMARVLGDLGFDVTPADGGNAAIAQLSYRDFDVILSDWYMSDGSGAELYEWLRTERPALAPRCVFVSGADPNEFAELAPGRIMLPKGQDSPELFALLMSIVEGAELPPPASGEGRGGGEF